MPRSTRVVVPGLPHHITQRGNRRATTFHDSRDRQIYMRLLGEYAERYGFVIWAYALMTNHVHLVGVPEDERSLSSMMRDAHSAYAFYFNRSYNVVGHLWQGRFYSSVLDWGHALNAVRYVELNPVRAGMTEHAEDYDWSSAAAHCGLRNDPLLVDDVPPGIWPMDWSAWLAEGIPGDQIIHIRKRTFSGSPSGPESFVREIENRLGRPIRARKRGRPKKIGHRGLTLFKLVEVLRPKLGDLGADDELAVRLTRVLSEIFVVVVLGGVEVFQRR